MVVTAPPPQRSRPVRRVAALLRLARIRNSATGALYTVLGAYLASDAGQAVAPPVLRAALVVLLVIACGNVINDYRDADADAIAKPERPIPSGSVSRTTAGWLAVALALAALALAATLEWRLLLFAAGTIVVAAAYSYRLKSIPLAGNATVGALCGAILLYGGLAAGEPTAAVYAACAMTFFYVFAQEVFYTIEDETGDRLSRVPTTATRLGVQRTAGTFKLLVAAFVIVSLVPWLLGAASDIYLYALVAFTIAPTIGVVGLLTARFTHESIRLASWLTRVIWFSSALPIALLK